MLFCRRITVVTVLFFASLSASASKPDARHIVENFYISAFVERNIAAAADQYVNYDYIQHNPYLPNGKEPLVSFFSGYFKKYPELIVSIKRILVDNDMVVVHSHWQLTEQDRGSAVIDIFRVANGQIIEHWDAVQKIPEKSANKNSMF